MKDIKIYFVLFVLAVWITGATYWINSKICYHTSQRSNKFSSESYKLPKESGTISYQLKFDQTFGFANP